MCTLINHLHMFLLLHFFTIYVIIDCILEKLNAGLKKISFTKIFSRFIEGTSQECVHQRLRAALQLVKLLKWAFVVISVFLALTVALSLSTKCVLSFTFHKHQLKRNKI